MLCASVEAMLTDASPCREARRAISLMNRIGVYQHANTVSREIVELGERFRVPSNEYKQIQKALDDLGKAQRVIEDLSKNKAVQFACGEKADPRFFETAAALLDFLGIIRAKVEPLVGRTGKRRRVPPMARLSPKYFFDIF